MITKGSGPLLTTWFQKYTQYQFLFEELVKRDFKNKYKGTVLGMAWSILSPLLTLFVMRLVFTQFFGGAIPHYTTYLFSGNLVFSFFSQSTSQGMTVLMRNASIINKVTFPKYMFVLSDNVSSFVNFLLSLCVFFLFALADGILFNLSFFALLFPVFFLLVFNIGVGLILSALFVFFRDMSYFYGIFILLLMYCSAIFYNIDGYSPGIQRLFLANPVYIFIKYFRVVVIDGNLPSFQYHALILLYTAVVVGIGSWMYKKYNQRFLYYM
jgi:ABC-2 type transport system permease protein